MENKDIVSTQSLPQEQEQRAMELAEKINLDDPALTTTYATETMSNISRFADSLLERVRVKDAGKVGDTLSTLLDQVKGFNPRSLVDSKPGILERMPLIGSMFNSTTKSLNQFKTLADQVEIISNKLEDTMTGLLYDIEVLEQLYAHNKTFHEELSVHIEAGKLRLQKAREEDLPKLMAEAENVKDSMAAQNVRDFSEKINRFERRLHDLQLSRTITLQTAPQIRLIQNNNQTLAEKIQTSILSTIPLWKNQMVLALSLQTQKEAAQLQKNVADTTNAMLQNNADMLQEATVETAKQVERAIVDIETVRDVHAKLLSTIEETLRIAQEGREQRMLAEQELAVMERDLKEKLTALAVSQSSKAITAASGENR